jgi:hypothetical protein
MGDLIGFEGYMNTTTPFSVKEHKLIIDILIHRVSGLIPEARIIACLVVGVAISEVD